MIKDEGQKIVILDWSEHLVEGKGRECKGFPDELRSDTLRGRLVSGLGEGQHYVSREGYRKQFREKLGFEPFPGTLNIRLDLPFDSAGRCAINVEGFLDEGGTFGKCACYRAKVNGIEAAIVRPEKSSYPPDMVEVIAPIRLRSSLALADGDEVMLTLEE